MRARAATRTTFALPFELMFALIGRAASPSPHFPRRRVFSCSIPAYDDRRLAYLRRIAADMRGSMLALLGPGRERDSWPLRFACPTGCACRSASAILGGMTRLAAPRSGDQPQPGRQDADPLWERLHDLPPNHPSSPKYARPERPRLPDTSGEDDGQAEAAVDTRPVPPEGHSR